MQHLEMQKRDLLNNIILHYTSEPVLAATNATLQVVIYK